MSHEVEEFLVVPAGLESFVAHGDLSRVASEDIERQLSDDGEIGGPVLLSGSGLVFSEQDVELPVEVVFDLPVSSDYAEQFEGGEALGQGIGAALVPGDALAGSRHLDAGDGDQSDQSLGSWRLGERRHHDAADFVAAVGRILGFEDRRSGVGGGFVQRGDGLFMQLGLIGLDGDHIVAAILADGLGHAPMAVESVGGDSTALQRQDLEGFDRALRLAALGRQHLGQAHEGLAVEHVGHQRRHVGATLVVSSPQALAVDGQTPLADDVASRLGAESGHEAAERGVERLRVEHAQDGAEGVVAGRAALQGHELAQKLQSRLSKHRHPRAIDRTAKHRRQSHKQGCPSDRDGY